MFPDVLKPNCLTRSVHLPDYVCIDGSIDPIDDELITEQQKATDTYAQLKLIPKQISIKDATLTLEEYAAIALS